MNILMVTHGFPPDLSGGESYVAQLTAEILCERGINLTVLCPAQRNAENYDAKTDYEVKRVRCIGSNFFFRTLSFYLASRSYIRSFKGDLVYYFRPAAINPDRPSVYHLHTWRPGLSRSCFNHRQYITGVINHLIAPLDRAMAKNCTRLISPSAHLTSLIRSSMGDELAPIDTIPNPVKRQSPVTNDRVRRSPGSIIYVGRLDRAKGIDDLIRATKVLSDAGEPTRLDIVGSGPDLGRLQRLVEEQSLSEIAVFRGHIPNERLVREFENYEMLVLPSHYETFGLVIAESLYAGLPCISSDACADLGQPTFPAGDVDALVGAIRDLRDVYSSGVGHSYYDPLLLEGTSVDRVGASLIECFEKAAYPLQP